MAVPNHATVWGSFCYEDLRRTPDDGKRYEVLEGVKGRRRRQHVDGKVVDRMSGAGWGATGR